MKTKEIMKKQTKAERIRLMLKQGSSVKEAAAVCGVTAQAVYNVKYQDKRRAKVKAKTIKVKRPRGRPRKVQNTNTNTNANTNANTFTTPVVQVGEATLEYHPARLSLRQRLKALFTGRI